MCSSYCTAVVLGIVTKPYPALGAILISLVLSLHTKKKYKFIFVYYLSHLISNFLNFLLYIITRITHTIIINTIAADITITTDTVTDTEGRPVLPSSVPLSVGDAIAETRLIKQSA